jgi:hypothetical protein
VDQRRSLDLGAEAAGLDNKNDIVNSSNNNDDRANDNDDHLNQPAVNCNKQPSKGQKKHTKETPSESPTIMEEVDQIEAALDNPTSTRTLTCRWHWNVLARQKNQPSSLPALLERDSTGRSIQNWKMSSIAK